ncbi:uncharacterized protein Z519_05379 [Cladophialophora bantiana CBS 173.52]|uniref:Uncharacterized protein n=1 Tax=Cladophialophora bantiana (strain ATCC 10958 / CBS 173.52 / CDC B-1940 / NIH 8579) TaxID=1442370 RepID=A0A0D2HLB4_CLAB1|nr:uncharacterized protein Z519_05379 [Cladophialophora bantiana CBS 173.52]KIW94063.1 hypothetical protein Z519_05379 [Cladophialophora bantiana CBS 173.52]
MTTLLDDTGLPVWVYIVIIAVGSILLLLTIAAALRCWFLRRRANQRREVDNLTGPLRRVTLRRGRIVPTSQHLSLTGSKFGMRQFGVLADNESTMTGRKSPFEWWSTIMDRSQSRQEYMSQAETGSINTRPTSRATTITLRRELFTATPVQTPERSKEPLATRTWEITIPSPSPSPSPLGPNKHTNFSRSFSNRAPSSPVTQRSQATLSRILERSPHQSMISTANGPNMSPLPRSSYHSAINPLDSTPLAGQSPQPSPAIPREQMTLTVPAATTRSKTSLSRQQDHPSSSNLIPSSNRQHELNPSPPTASRLLEPKPLPYPMPPSATHSSLADVRSQVSSSFYRQMNQSQANLSHPRQDSKTNSPATSTTNLSRMSVSSIGPSGIIYETQVPRLHHSTDYWSTRLDIHDVSSHERNSSAPRSGHSSRNSSTDQTLRPQNSSPGQYREQERENVMGILTVPGKNNQKVLRKKSLKRMQVVSSVAT